MRERVPLYSAVMMMTLPFTWTTRGECRIFARPKLLCANALGAREPNGPHQEQDTCPLSGRSQTSAGAGCLTLRRIEDTQAAFRLGQKAWPAEDHAVDRDGCRLAAAIAALSQGNGPPPVDFLRHHATSLCDAIAAR